MFTSYTQLNATQIHDLEALRDRCKQDSGSSPNIYTHILAQLRMLPACLLHYENNILIGFLSVFFFYDEAVEVSVLVDPSARRKGLATELLRTIMPLITGYDIKKLIFSCPNKQNDALLKKLGFTYMHCEYFMVRDNLNPILEFNNILTFKMAETEDTPVLGHLDELCFHKNPGETDDRYYNLIGNRQYTIFIAMKDKKVVGKAHIRWEAQSASLSDIAVMPALQGRGYGTALIAHSVNHILEEGKKSVNLDVETHNEKALHLYTQLGFVIDNACDYWSIELNHMLSILNKIPAKTF